MQWLCGWSIKLVRRCNTLHNPRYSNQPELYKKKNSEFQFISPTTSSSIARAFSISTSLHKVITLKAYTTINRQLLLVIV